MRFPSKEAVERIRAQFPAGCRVELVRMDDPQAPPVGTKGTVQGVDDTGSLLMSWDNGSGLNVVYEEDVVRKVTESLPGKLFQVRFVRKDEEPDEIYTYNDKTPALEHSRLFESPGDAELYFSIIVSEYDWDTRSEKVISQVNFM